MSASAAIVALDVSVQFGDYRALRDIRFVLPAGGFLAVIGPNGAGKSTLIRALLGLVKLTSGRLQVLGRDPAQLEKNQVGYVPQIKTLDRQFPALPLELVVSGLRGTWPWRIRPAERAAAMAALKRVGMEELADRPVAKLSGGELQRVYLARAIVRHPALVVLDEPATGMDVVGEADMYRLLESYRAEHHAAVAMVTHDWEVARHHATHVLLLDRRQIHFGPPEEVLTDAHLRHAYSHMGHHHSMEVSPAHDHAGHHHDH